MDYRKISGNIRKKYMMALVVLILIILGRQVVYQIEHENVWHVSERIDMAGKQRMLSQQITKDVAILLDSQDSMVKAYYLKELQQSLNEWEEAHTKLQRESEDSLLLSDTVSPEITALYNEIQENHLKMLSAGREFIQLAEGENPDKESMYEKAAVLKENEKSFLEGMDRIVKQYVAETEERENSLGKIEQFLFFCIMTVIFGIHLLILRPAERFLTDAFEEVSENKDNITKIFNTIQVALVLVDERTRDILLMNGEAARLFPEKTEVGSNIQKSVLWKTMQNKKIPEKLERDGSINGVELEVAIGEDQHSCLLLSATKGIYHGKAAILLSLFDISAQKKAEETMRQMATNDELTGLYNRHYIDIVVEKEIQRVEKEKQPASVLIMDIDYFKKINDTWGHPLGDSILKKTAQLAAFCTRENDSLIRIGGEEFLLFMPGAEEQEAAEVAERIRRTVEEYVHPIIGQYTVSVGVAQRLPGETFQELYKRADEALYEAKTAGRNRVTVKAFLPVEESEIPGISWKEEWTSGNREIDDQHRELMEYANDIMKRELKNVDGESIKDEIALIRRQIMDHFESEEEIIKKAGYQDWEKHKKIHEDLMHKTDSLCEAFGRGEENIRGICIFLVEEVIIGHMLGEDTSYFPYTKE